MTSRGVVQRLGGLRPPLARALALSGVLLAELVVFGIAFDLGVLPPDSNWWSRVLIRTPRIIAALIAAAMAAGFIGGKTLWQDAACWYECRSERHRWRLWLILHLTLTAIVYWTTARIFRQAEAGTAPSLHWTLVWFGLASGAMACSALALFPAALWPKLIWRARWPLLSGIPLGGIAWLAAWTSGRVGWKLLGDATVVLVDRILRLIYAETVSDSSTMTIGTPDFAVDVVATCSGYQGIGLISVFLSVYLWLFRERLRFPRALLLLPLGICAIWLANVLRIVLLIIVGASGWPEIAHGGFHSQAGWLAFNAVALGFVAYAGQSRYLNRGVHTAASAPARDPTTAYLAPFLGVVVTAMVTAIFVTSFDWYYPARVAVAAVLLTFFHGDYGELWNCPFSWRPVWIGAAAFLVWLWLVPPPAASGAMLSMPADAPAAWMLAWLAAKTIGYVFITPVVEELAFRGYLMRRLVSPDFLRVDRGQLSIRSLIVSSLLFGVLHGQHWLPASLAGVAFGLALRQRGKLADAVVAHMSINGLIASVVFATGHWYLWA